MLYRIFLYFGRGTKNFHSLTVEAKSLNGVKRIASAARRIFPNELSYIKCEDMEGNVLAVCSKQTAKGCHTKRWHWETF